MNFMESTSTPVPGTDRLIRNRFFHCTGAGTMASVGLDLFRIQTQVILQNSERLICKFVYSGLALAQNLPLLTLHNPLLNVAEELQEPESCGYIECLFPDARLDDVIQICKLLEPNI